MSLWTHRAERTDLLADGLAGLLTTPQADPFAREVVVVPARGVERWLTQRLSHRLGVGVRGGDGVCAGVDFTSPHSLISLLLGREHDDPWDPDRLVWPLLRVVDESLDEAWCATLARHLGQGDADDLRRNRRFSVARRLAGLFSAYAAQRPQLVTDWREGRDTDGAGAEIDEDLRWQPELWRRVLAKVDAPPPDVRHAETVRALRDGGDGLDLPPRLSMFGHTRLSRTEVELIGALATQRDVHLWLPQVSATLWDGLAELSAVGPVPRAKDPSAERVGHPLLASLGRDARELQRTLALAGAAEGESLPAIPGEATTLLGWLQHDLRHNQAPDPATVAGRVRTTGDRSVQVHACHGSARQVDVLREVLVGLLEDDPTLEPRDILVLCPDIEAYAPLFSAGFGLADVAEAGHPAHDLRVRLADRSLSATNPLLAVAATLVELAGGRLTATEVLDLAATAPVRERFDFGDDDLDRMRTWVDQAGIRWGIDRAHREGAFGVDLDENTWAAGLDRVLLGVAMSGDDHRFAGHVLPIDDVGSGDVDLVGRFTEFMDRLNSFVRATERAVSVTDWTGALGSAVAGLTSTPVEDTWRVAQFDRELARIAATASGDTMLRRSDVRTLLAHRLGGRPTRSNFRTGTLTVCTMVPMRSVPHRVVALVGLDDGVFPRNATVDGDDVLARRAHTGERDSRAEDRQLLLDAILAATEKLVITYTGAGEHTGATRPPAVPLGELLDALELTATGVEGVLVRHPLQPFDVKNLVVGRLVPDRPFSFDRTSLEGAEASRGPRVEVGPLVPGPLPAADNPEVSLEELKGFFSHPVRTFLKRRLDVVTVTEAKERNDAIPIDLDALEKWGVGDRLVTDVLNGMNPQAGMTAEQLRGLLPPGRLGVRQLEDVVRVVQPIVDKATELRQGPPRSLDIDLELDGVRVTGTISSVFGNDLVTVTYSSLGPRQRLTAWIDTLALAAAHPDEMWRSHAVGRKGSGAQRALAGPLDHRAGEWLVDLVDVYRRGLCEPLPLPPRTALAYAEESARLRSGVDADPDRKAAAAWTTDRFGDRGIPGEDADAWHIRAFGEQAPYSCLTGPPRDDEQFNDERHRLGQYAWRVWSPLLLGMERVRAL